MIRLVLPYPVSANRYWRQVPLRGTNRTAIALSDEAKQYKRAAGWLAKQAGVRQPLRDRLEVRYWLTPQAPQDAARRAAADPGRWDMSVRCIDLDNANKVLMDSLNGIVWEDDSQVHRIVAERAEPGTAQLVVEIEAWTPGWIRQRALLDLAPATPESTALAV